MKISVLTLFPEMFTGVFDHSIIKRARDKQLIEINLVQIRDSASGKYKTVDDRPYGGGAGMILKVDVIDRSISATIENSGISRKNTRIILTDPAGSVYKQSEARKLSEFGHLVIIAGHYEGYDERIRGLVDEVYSTGDYILTGGEIPAMAIVDSVARLVPGTLAKSGVTDDESFTDPGMLEYPQYTRPHVYQGRKVPEILLSGNHAQIEKWKREQKIVRTQGMRPDLLTGLK